MKILKFIAALTVFGALAPATAVLTLSIAVANGFDTVTASGRSWALILGIAAIAAVVVGAVGAWGVFPLTRWMVKHADGKPRVTLGFSVRS